MPKQIFDVKEFLALAANKKTPCRIVVKKNKDATKFKARGPRSLVTLVLKDQKKAEKLIASLKPFKPEIL